jgi:hypothetical protein
MKEKYDNLYERINNLHKENNIIKNKISQTPEDVNMVKDNEQIITQLKQIADDHSQHRDRQALSDPLYPPLKRNYHFSDPHINRMPINIETRESGGDYQQIGMLNKTTNVNADLASPGSNTDSYILPLFGKPIYKGSSNWLYYTTSNGGIKVPLTVNNKDCTDDNGCKEINNGETIDITEFNGSFNVKMYQFDKPRYIPHIL